MTWLSEAMRPALMETWPASMSRRFPKAERWVSSSKPVGMGSFEELQVTLLPSCKLSITKLDTENPPFRDDFLKGKQGFSNIHVGLPWLMWSWNPSLSWCLSCSHFSTKVEHWADRSAVGKQIYFWWLCLVSWISLVDEYQSPFLYTRFLVSLYVSGVNRVPLYSWISELRELAIDAVYGSLDGCRLSMEELSMRWVHWWVLKHGFYTTCKQRKIWLWLKKNIVRRKRYSKIVWTCTINQLSVV